jgi:hypothetical protein
MIQQQVQMIDISTNNNTRTQATHDAATFWRKTGAELAFLSVAASCVATHDAATLKNC